MNTLINEKQQQIEVLKETKNQYEEALKGVTDSETIKDSAINNGMVE